MGLGDFAGSKFQWMANWPGFDFLNSKLVELHETGHLFRALLPVSLFFIETGPVGHPLEFTPAKPVNPTIKQIPLENRPIAY